MLVVQIMNFYGKLIIERSSKSNRLPSIYVHSTQFMTKYLKSGYKAISKWTKKVRAVVSQTIYLGIADKYLFHNLVLGRYFFKKITIYTNTR